jgi:hypothetical protein
MNQPEILEEGMFLNFRVVRTNGEVETFRVNVKDVENYQIAKLYLMNSTGDVIRDTANMGLFIQFLIDVLNYPVGTSQSSDTFTFTLGVDGYFFNIAADWSTDANFTVVDLLSSATQGRGILKLEKGEPIQSVALSGTFLKVFDLDPTQAIVFERDSQGVEISLKSSGHEYIVVRCNECKNTIDNLMSKGMCKYSNVLCVIPTPGTDFVYYQNPHVGSKLMLNTQTLDNVDLMFHDKWGHPLLGIRDFFLELTIDFVRLSELRERTNVMDMKRPGF